MILRLTLTRWNRKKEKKLEEEIERERERKGEKEILFIVNYDLYIECFSLQIIITNSQLMQLRSEIVCNRA